MHGVTLPPVEKIPIVGALGFSRSCECPYCGKKLATKHSVTRHINVLHPEHMDESVSHTAFTKGICQSDRFSVRKSSNYAPIC